MEKNNVNSMNFIGSLIVIIMSLSIFYTLMDKEIPTSNRELLIAFVASLFGATVASIKKITGGK
jgi:hypothetical protein